MLEPATIEIHCAQFRLQTMTICRRYHLLEIDDQPWFPSSLRANVQAVLTLFWTFRIPVLQRLSPAELVASTIGRELGSRTSEYTYVDFCSGAGGPTPQIETFLNAQLAQTTKHDKASAPVQFLLTDLHPHIEAWKAAAKKSDYLSFIAEPVNAAEAPKDLLTRPGNASEERRLFRLFSLAFHHFDDEIAINILENTLETADGFGIFELQDRSIFSFLLVAFTGPLLFLLTPFFFYNSLQHLLFTYLCPIVPFVIQFDGYISCLRTRTPEEVLALLQIAAERLAKKMKGNDDLGYEPENKGRTALNGWTFRSGSTMHTPPIGRMTWIMCTRN